MSTLEERFGEEVRRLGILKVSRELGVVSNTIYNWIAKGNAPLNILDPLKNLGADVCYIITGSRKSAAISSQQLTEQEVEFVAEFRQVSVKGRMVALAMMKAMEKEVKTTTSMMEDPNRDNSSMADRKAS